MGVLYIHWRADDDDKGMALWRKLTNEQLDEIVTMICNHVGLPEHCTGEVK